MTYCTDTDLIRWEPGLALEASFASQTLIRGQGTLAGNRLSIAEGSFLDAGVEVGGVLVIDDESTRGCFPIRQVDADKLIVTPVFVGLDDETFDPEQPSPGFDTTEGVSFVVRSFWAQREVVSRLIEQAADLRAGWRLTNPESVRTACVLGTLQMIYSALAAVASADAPDWSVRAALYERLYRRSLRGTRIEIDTNGDGLPDCGRSLGLIRFRRV